MAVIGVKSITGITSITNAAGGADVLTFHSNNTTERVRIQADGGVAVGTNAVSAGDLATGSTIGLPKLHVDCGHLGNGAYHIARFRAGSDNDWNAAVLTINHSNDRGIAIYGGRSSGNASWGAIKAIDNQGRLTNAFEIVGAANNGVEDIKFYTGASTTTTERIRITSAGKVGIGTNNPSQKVSIANGRVNIDVKNDHYGVWADGDTQGENHISVGRWYNTGGGLKSGYSQYGINNLILENNHPTASHTLIIQPNGQKVSIGTHISDGLVHIGQHSAGTVTADADADELVLENSGNVGLSLLTAGTGESSIYFGNPGTNGQKDGWLKYYHESHSTTANRRCLSFKTGGGSEKMRLDSAGRLLIGVTAPSTSSSERFEVSGMSLFMNNSSTTGTVYIRNQASDAGTGHVLVFQDGSANRGGITLDNNDRVTMHGHQGVVFKTGGTLGGGNEVARFNNGGGLQLSNTGANKGIIWISPGGSTFANVQGSGGRGIISTQVNNIAPSTATDLAKSHWGGLCLIGWANSTGNSTNYQGHEQVMFGYGGTPSSRYKRQFAGNLTVTYTMSAYTLRVNHNGNGNIDFWCILIGV